MDRGSGLEPASEPEVGDTSKVEGEEDDIPQPTNFLPSVIATGDQTTGAGTDSLLENKKVEVLLKAVGGAPVKKQKKFRFLLDQRFSEVMKFIAGEKYLKLTPNDSLFVYVNQAFAPSPDQTLQNLFDCFGVEGKLVLHYCLTKAWG